MLLFPYDQKRAWAQIDIIDNAFIECGKILYFVKRVLLVNN